MMPNWTYFANPTNITDMTTLLQYTNSISGSAFVPAIMMAIFAVVFVSMLFRFSFASAFGVSSFSMFILAVLFRAMNVTTDFVVITATLLMFLAAGILLFKKET